MDDLIRKSSVLTITIALIISLVLLFNKKMSWAGGVLIGTAWMSANLLLTINLLKIALLQKDITKMPALLLLKFPVLYLGGFFLLSSKLFPALSLLAGVTVVFLAIGAVKLCPRVK